MVSCHEKMHSKHHDTALNHQIHIVKPASIYEQTPAVPESNYNKCSHIMTWARTILVACMSIVCGTPQPVYLCTILAPHLL